MSEQNKTRVLFLKQDSFGANDAADDKDFLDTCFVDTGDFSVLESMSDARCLILGRTGVGKTALLTKIKETKGDRVIRVDPEAMAMQHISNSTIINYLDEMDIDLNTFFKLLWRHALCVEIFIHHFKISSEFDYDKLLEDMRYRLKNSNPRHLRALDYLDKWRNTFWKEDESHVTEMINKTESKFSGELGGTFSVFKAGLSKHKNLSEEEKISFKKRAQKIVDDTQMKEVSDLISMLDEVIGFQQKQYYLVIDELDEGWVDNKLRYRLIKALIETVRDLGRIENVKPLVVLRADLLGQVFDATSDSGFQEEKYRSLYLDVRWTKIQLTNLIDLRINQLLKSRYSKRTMISHRDILPESISNMDSMEYILSRTLMRPRDLIEFFNACINQAADSPLITEAMVLDAERNYSRERLKSIYYEWTVDYPRLKEWVKVLRRKHESFFVGSLATKELKDLCIDYILSSEYIREDLVMHDRLHTLAYKVTESQMSEIDFRNNLLHIFYTVGLIGIQLEGFKLPTWSYISSEKVEIEDINDSTMITIHPCFVSVLNIEKNETM